MKPKSRRKAWERSSLAMWAFLSLAIRASHAQTGVVSAEPQSIELSS